MRATQLMAADEPLAVERITPEAENLDVGEWYWVNDVETVNQYDDEGEITGKVEKPITWLGCVMHIGSNYVLLEGKEYEDRIHIEQFDSKCIPAHNYRDHIVDQVAEQEGIYRDTVQKIQEVCDRLGVMPRDLLVHVPEPESKALSIVGDGVGAAERYKQRLIKAKGETLPALHEKARDAMREMAEWRAMETLPLQAKVGVFEGTSDRINDRIFNLKLYAGLAEDVWHIQEGEPAPMDEPLHVYQRRLYMDVECLAGYEHGGIDCESINDFDRWLLKPGNLNRILPHPRCMVAFRVRCERNSRPAYRLADMWVNIRLEEKDKWTFLYVRNGENVYCIATDVELGESLFPNEGALDLSEPMVARRNDWSDLVSVREKEHAIEQWKIKHSEWKKQKAAWKNWRKKHPHKNDRDEYYSYSFGTDDNGEKNPFGGINCPHEPKEPFTSHTHPFNDSSVYFDDMQRQIEKQVEYFNRIGIIIQGLYDRSEILHPHPPYKTWDGEGFKLVYDGDRTLHDGDPPDIKAYIEECNEQADENSYFIGQEDAWLLRGGKRETNRRANNWNYRGDQIDVERYSMPGDPGPGKVAQPARWMPRARKAVFKWKRERVTYDRWNDEPIDCSITVSIEQMFNVSAYKPGDYKRFFADPRTRKQYLRWAPLLITAEEWHAGNTELVRKKNRSKRRRKRQ